MKVLHLLKASEGTSATSVAQIAFSPFSVSGLVGGALAGTLIAFALSVYDVMRFDRQRLAWPSWNAVPLVLLRYSRIELAGQYWFAYLLRIAPVALFNGAYRQATLPTMGRGARSAMIRMARQHSVILPFLAAMAAIIFFFFGETLFALLRGGKWQQAGAMVAWLGIGLSVDVIKIPAICLFQSRAGRRSLLIWKTVIAVVRCGAALPFLIRGDVIAAIATFSPAGFVGWFSFSAYCLSGETMPEISEAEGGGAT